MHFFYVSINCPECDEEVLIKCATNVEVNGLPVVPAGIVLDEALNCEECGARFGGTFEVEVC